MDREVIGMSVYETSSKYHFRSLTKPQDMLTQISLLCTSVHGYENNYPRVRGKIILYRGRIKYEA